MFKPREEVQMREERCGDIWMVRRMFSAGGGGICALKVAGKRCGQVVCGREASQLEAERQGESVGAA